jgi:hypothetical protein
MKPQMLRRYIADTIKKSLEARQITGKPVLSQLTEMLKLHFSEGKITPVEYFNFELYNDQLFSFAAKCDFVGDRGKEKLHADFNNLHWRAMATDKILFYILMRGLGLRIPKLYAVYGPARRALNGVPCITDAGVMRDFLQTGISYPFFAKPVRGAHGIGGIAVNSFDRGNDTLLLRTGQEVRVHDFVTNLLRLDERGYIFQECLVPHPEIRQACGDTLSTIRMIVLLLDSGPCLFRAYWRIPRASNMTDNFARGRLGNLVGQIDLKSGRVLEAIAGVGASRTLAKVHPDTGRPIIGMILPDWQDAVKTCLSTATALPALRLQHWDVAMCPDGPLLVEVNATGDVGGVQCAYRTGFRNTELRQFLRP